MVLDALDARVRGEASASITQQPVALLVLDDGDLSGVFLVLCRISDLLLMEALPNESEGAEATHSRAYVCL
jgi:hypothetical protein